MITKKARNIDMLKTKEAMRPVIDDIIDDAMRAWRRGDWSISDKASLNAYVVKLLRKIIWR